MTQLAPPPVFRAWDNNGIPLAGGLLFSYVAGSTTKQATFTDSTGGTPNTNPVVLNYRGEAQIWLDPAKVYKLVLAPSTDTDPPTNPFWTVDQISGGGASPSFNIIPTVDNLFTLGSTTFSWANVYVGPNHAPILDAVTGNIGYFKQTAAEIAALVTPVNFSYPPMYVDRYATNTTPGTTSMAAAFTAAVKVAQKGGGTVRYGATAPYLLDAPINCTFAGSANQWGVVIRGDSVSADGSPTQVLIAKHTGHVFDCTGNDCIEFYDVCVRTDAVTFPQTGVLWARNTGVNSQINRMQNCRFIGNFSVACLYNYASEDDVVIGNYFYNTCTAAGTACAIWTANNINNLTSSFTAIHVGAISCIDHTVVGNQFFNQGATATSDCVRLESVESWKCYGGWAYAQSGRALVYVDMTNASSSNCVVHGLTGEQSSGSLHAYGILFSNHVQTPSGWTIDSCKLTSTTFAIAAAGANPVADNFHVRNIIEQVGHGFNWPGNIQKCNFDVGAMPIIVSSDTNSSFKGFSESWTIAARNKDFWIDQGTTNKTWTPNTSALTITGALTVVENVCLAYGSLVTVSVRMHAATSIVCAAGTALSGLPFASAFRSAQASVYNLNTTTGIGQAAVQGSSILLPAINVGALVDIIITATYFAA